MKKNFVYRVALAMALVICLGFAVVSAFAADTDYAPSIEVKTTPEIVTPEGASSEIGAVINAGETSEQIKVNDIYKVSYGEAKKNVADVNFTDETKKAACQALVNAYDAFKAAGVENSIENIKSFAEETLKISNPEYFVSNLFELNIGEHDSKLDGDSTVTVRFLNDESINAENGKLVVAHMVDGKWAIVPNESVKVTEDVVEVTFDDLCPVVFINLSQGAAADVTPQPDDDGADDGMDDGVIIALVVIAGVTVLIVAAIVVFYVLEKKDVLTKISQKASGKNKK